MAKSRVEKNKTLYEELELEPFELEDIASEPKKTDTKKAEETQTSKKQEIVPVKEKKNEVAVVKEKKKIKVEEVFEEEFVVEQPISYTNKLSVEEILRAKLEQQQQLKDSKKGYKKSPNTKTYTPEMMQKNINVKEGVDIRKEANIRVKKNRNGSIAFLVFLLIVVIAAGIGLAYLIL